MKGSASGGDVRLEAIRASAGAGKTYTLTLRYIDRLVSGASVSSILATTFTRKAAGEIGERVFLRLAASVLDEGEAKRLASDLGRPGMGSADFECLLLRLTASMHRMMITTIDGYFNRLIQAFRVDLGLPADLELVDGGGGEVMQERLEAIGALLSDIDRMVLVNLLAMLHPGMARRSVTETLNALVAQLYPVYQAGDHERWLMLRVPAGGGEEDLDQALRHLERVADEVKGKRLKKTLVKIVEALRAGDEQGALSIGLVTKILQGETEYYRSPIPEDVLDAMAPVVSGIKARALRRLAHQTEATALLLQAFDRYFSSERRRRGTLLFSELPLILARGLTADADETAYRLGASIEHLLLDELQDTSPEQWAVLGPLARRIAENESERGSLFCVGDVKQAIYGWRGGSAEIFDRLGDEIPGVRWSERATSWRSSAEVLDVVNRVFSSLTTNVALKQYSAAARSWQAGFEPHRPERGHRGFVTLLSASSPLEEEEGESKDVSCDAPSSGPVLHFKPIEREGAAMVAALARRMPGAEIGVLVKTNDMVRKLRFLLQELGVSASGEGGASIDDDPAVEVFLSALILADHPGDRIAAFHVAHSPLGIHLGIASEAGMKPDVGSIAVVSSALRKRLMHRGLARELSSWVEAVAPACGVRSMQRLAQLLVLAERHDRRAGRRIRDFVTMVRETMVEEPYPSRVRVMTVHKSKGLEFDLVVLLELDKKILGMPPQVLVNRPDPMGPIQAVYRYPRKALRELDPDLADAYRQYETREIKEALCELYVAMTRARFALYMLVAPPKRTKKGELSFSRGTPAAILRAALVDPAFEERESGGQVLFAHGDPKFYRDAPELTRNREAARPEVVRDGARVVERSSVARGLKLVSPSRLSSGGGVSVRRLLRLDSASALLRGKIMHSWFEAIEWLNDVVIDPDAFIHIAVESHPHMDPNWIRGLFNDFERMLEAADVRSLLSRPSIHEGERVELWRERPFAVCHEGVLVQGRFDRVSIVERKGMPRRVTLIDFKTGEAEPDDIKAFLNNHRPQMEAYRAALKALLGLSDAQIDTWLVLGCGRALRVD